MPAFTVPKYKYLGPGNKLNAGVPKNKLDAHARAHDHGYSDSVDAEGVDLVDNVFEDRAWKEGWLGNAAANAIHLKSAFEKNVLGQRVYPWKQYSKGMPATRGVGGGKRKPEEQLQKPDGGKAAHEDPGMPLTPHATPRKGEGPSGTMGEEPTSMDIGVDAVAAAGNSATNSTGAGSIIPVKYAGLPKFKQPHNITPHRFAVNRTVPMMLNQNCRAVFPQLCFLANFASKNFRFYLASNAGELHKMDTITIKRNKLRIDGRQNLISQMNDNFNLIEKAGTIGTYKHIKIQSCGIGHTVTLGLENVSMLKDHLNWYQLKDTSQGYLEALQWGIKGFNTDFWDCYTGDSGAAKFVGMPVQFNGYIGQNVDNSDANVANKLIPWATDRFRLIGGFIHICIGRGYDEGPLPPQTDSQMFDNPWLTKIGTHTSMVADGSNAWPVEIIPSSFIGASGQPIQNMADWLQGMFHPDGQERHRNYTAWKWEHPSTKEEYGKNRYHHQVRAQVGGVFNNGDCPGLMGSGQNGYFYGNPMTDNNYTGGYQAVGNEAAMSIDDLRGRRTPWQQKNGGQIPWNLRTPALRDAMPEGFEESDGTQPIDFALPENISLPTAALFCHVFVNVVPPVEGDVSPGPVIAISAIVVTNSREIPWHRVGMRNMDGSATVNNYSSLQVPGLASGATKQWRGVNNLYYDYFTCPPWVGIMSVNNGGDFTNFDNITPLSSWGGLVTYEPPSYMNPSAKTSDLGYKNDYFETGPERQYDIIAAPCTLGQSGTLVLGEYQNLRASREMEFEFHCQNDPSFLHPTLIIENEYRSRMYQAGVPKPFSIWPCRRWVDLNLLDKPCAGQGKVDFDNMDTCRLVLPL